MAHGPAGHLLTPILRALTVGSPGVPWTDYFTTGPTSPAYDVHTQYAITPGYLVSAGVIRTDPDFQQLTLTRQVVASGDDQYVEMTIPSSPYADTTYGLGILQPAAWAKDFDGYQFWIYPDGRIYMFRDGDYVGGGPDLFVMPSSGPFTLRLEKVGPTVSIKLNGVTIPGVSYTDSTPLTNGGVRSYQAVMFHSGSNGVTAAAGGDVPPPPYSNHATIVGGRNGTTTHTVSPNGTGGTVIAGKAFTPTAGRFLMVIVEGGATSYGSLGSPAPNWDYLSEVIGNVGLYVWSKTAGVGGSDTVAVNHNGPNYPIIFDFYELPAGTTFVGESHGAPGKTSLNPALSSLVDPNLCFGIRSQGVNPDNGASTVWGSEVTEATDAYVPFGVTDGCYLTVGYSNNWPMATYTPTGIVTSTNPSVCESITLAFKTPPLVLFTENWNTPDATNWDYTKWPHQRPAASIVSNKGVVPAGSPSVIMADRYVTDFEMTVKMAWDASAPAYPEICWRQFDGLGGYGSSSGYCIQIKPSGQVDVLQVGSYSGVGTGVTDSALVAAGTRWFKVRAVGNNHKVKWWNDGSAEPGTWQLDVNDATPLNDSDGVPVVGGAVGFRNYGTPPNITVDDLTVIDLASPPTPVAEGSMRNLSRAKSVSFHQPAFALDTDLTWCGWMYLSKMPVNTATFMSLFNGGAPYCITTVRDDGVLFQYMDTGDFTDGYVVPIKTWHFIAMSRSITGGTDLYYAPEGAALTKVHNASTGTVRDLYLRLLSDDYGAGPDVMGCAFKVWTAALTQAELETERPKYSAQRTTDLWGSWPMRNGLDYRSENPYSDYFLDDKCLFWEAGGVVSGIKPAFLDVVTSTAYIETGRSITIAATTTVSDLYRTRTGLYTDNFNRANTTTPLSGGYGLSGASLDWDAPAWAISGNKATRVGATGSDFGTFSSTIGFPDMFVEADYDRSGGGYCVVNARRPSTTNTETGYLGYVDPGGGAAHIAKSVAGTFSGIAGGDFSGSFPTTGRIRLECQGTLLTLKIDGVTIGSTNDSTITTGNYAGINGSAGAILDNFAIGGIITPIVSTVYTPLVQFPLLPMGG